MVGPRRAPVGVDAQRRRLAGALAAALPLPWLGACASEATIAGAAAAPSASAGAMPLLTPWLSITGGWRGELAPAPLPGIANPPRALPPPGTAARVQLLMPVAVAAQGDNVLIADAGARVVWRYLRSRDSLQPFVPLGAFAAGGATPGVALQLLADQSLVLTLSASGEVQQFDIRGQLVRRYRDERLAARPVAAVLSEDRSELWLADAQTRQLTRFSPQGLALGQVAGGRLPLQSIDAMVSGPAGLYLLDRLAQQVVLLGPQGEVRAAFGEGVLVQPRALAVDAAGRVFVADDADQSLHVFERGEPIARYTGAGNTRFGRIEALAIDGVQLYVADSLKARVQVLLIAAPSLLSPAPGARP